MKDFSRIILNRAFSDVNLLWDCPLGNILHGLLLLDKGILDKGKEFFSAASELYDVHAADDSVKQF